MQERKEYKMTLTQAQAEKMQQLINMTSFAKNVKFEEVTEVEEIADVKITLAQLELAVGKDGQQKIEDFYNAKIDRQMDRILKGE